MGVLDHILAHKRDEIAAIRCVAEVPREPLPTRISGTEAVERLRRPAGAPLRLITEIKRRSPSAGALSSALTVAERAAIYARGGAAAISVLTDGPFFHGSFDDLGAVAAATNVPLLCKDFILADVQLHRAAQAGASLVLLIVRILPDNLHLRYLMQAARSLHMEPLLEVVTEPELQRALQAGGRLVGVNARDLDTLQIDQARAERICQSIPSDIVALHLSGLRTPADVQHIATTSADGALLGEALMRQDDPTVLLTSLVAAAQGS